MLLEILRIAQRASARNEVNHFGVDGNFYQWEATSLVRFLWQ